MLGATEPAGQTFAAPRPKAIAMVLAGGNGSRLHPLTAERPKPAVPFGGTFRLVDFVLSNLVNSGFREIYVLTQYKSAALLSYLDEAWTARDARREAMIWPLPAGAPGAPPAYLGTADAVHRNADIIRVVRPDAVLVFGADHVYAMDIGRMMDAHLRTNADVTVAAVPMTADRCADFGTMAVEADGRVVRFEEKSGRPVEWPGRPGSALVSMGNYIFKTSVLLEELAADARDPESRHDFGANILPPACRRRKVIAYDFRENRIPGVSGACDYWRDVGTIRSYYEASMDLLDPAIHRRLHNPDWPVRPWPAELPPAAVTPDRNGRPGRVENAIVCGAAVIEGATVRNSIVGPGVRIESGAVVEDSVLLGGAVVGRKARLRRTILDQGARVAAGDRIGYEPERDAARFRCASGGLVVVTPGDSTPRRAAAPRPRRGAAGGPLLRVGPSPRIRLPLGGRRGPAGRPVPMPPVLSRWTGYRIKPLS